MNTISLKLLRPTLLRPKLLLSACLVAGLSSVTASATAGSAYNAYTNYSSYGSSNGSSSRSAPGAFHNTGIYPTSHGVNAFYTHRGYTPYSVAPRTAPDASDQYKSLYAGTSVDMSGDSMGGSVDSSYSRSKSEWASLYH